MNTDARLSIGFPSHPKTKKLIRALGSDGPWYLVRLWLWTSQNRADGDLRGISDEDIELAVDWPAKPGALVAALVELRFVDSTEGARRIHDWQQHNPWAAGHKERSDIARKAGLVSRYGKKKGERMFHVGQAKGRQAVNKESTTSQQPDDAPFNPVSLPSPSPSHKKEESKEVPPQAAETPKPDGRPTWNAYESAYEKRYSVAPVRNAKVNGQIAQFVRRIGAGDAPSVAAFFVSHNGAYYVQRGHSTDCLLSDAEKLRTEWASGRTVNGQSARMAEKTAANPFAKMLRDEIEKGGANVAQG